MSNRPKTGIVAAHQHSVTSYTGPLPPSAEFGRYEQILPGTAERIVSLAEKEAEHRRECDVKMIDKTFDVRRRGQNYALIVALSALVTAGICACFGQQVASVGLAITACVGLAAAFIKKDN